MVLSNWANLNGSILPTADNGPVEFVPSDLRTTRYEPSMVELPLLLPHWQIDALEHEATKRGLTTAQMLRRLIGDFFNRVSFPEPVSCESATPA